MTHSEAHPQQELRVADEAELATQPRARIGQVDRGAERLR
jgi:hypothetical protein